MQNAETLFRGYTLQLVAGLPAFFLVNTFPDNMVQVQGRSPLEPDEWYHLAVTYDGSGKAGGVRLLVNNQFIGRGLKVAKEEIIGLLEAVRIFIDEDEDAEMERYNQMAQQVVDAFVEVPGLRTTLEHDEFNYLIPHAVMKFTNEWKGIRSPMLASRTLSWAR